MPMAGGPDGAPVATSLMTDTIAKDAILAWFQGEFAAANAIIDALCGHLSQLSDGGTEYENVFAAIHRRRLNWIPVLQMQRYYSTAHVAVELRKVTVKKKVEKEARGVGFDGEDEKLKREGGVVKEIDEVEACLDEEVTVDDQEVSEELEIEEKVGEKIDEKMEIEEKVTEIDGNGGDGEKDDSPRSEITDSGSQVVQEASEENEICSNHEECESRPSQIKLTKGFSAKEPVKGHMVNVVKGLKLYEDLFTDSELSKLNEFVDELRSAGQNGELSGETFILFNQQVKGNRRELIQLGVPIFGQIKDDVTSNNQTSNIEPIPDLLQSVIDHLVQWQLIPQYKKPNGCRINIFEEGEHSQPFQRPPHLDHPISTLFLSESTVAFGRNLVSDNDGNYKGPLMLSLKEGALLVMRGNSADTARHVMCPSPNNRVSITFFRVRPDSNQYQSPTSPPLSNAMTLWQPGVPSPYALPNGASYGYETMNAMPKWGTLRAPVVMLAPVSPMLLSPIKIPPAGTGVFLPWKGGSRKPAKHLPPRAQKGKLLALPFPVETHVADPTSEKGV